jgi:hypothetical protein
MSQYLNEMVEIILSFHNNSELSFSFGTSQNSKHRSVCLCIIVIIILRYIINIIKWNAVKYYKTSSFPPFVMTVFNNDGNLLTSMEVGYTMTKGITTHYDVVSTAALSPFVPQFRGTRSLTKLPR